MFLFVPVCSGTFPTALILLLFLVFKKKKIFLFSAPGGRCRSCSGINLCEEGRSATPRQEVSIIVPCNFRWAGVKHKNPLLTSGFREPSLGGLCKSMASRRPRNTVYLGKVQSLQGAFESSRCVCAVPALGRVTERCCGIKAAAAPVLFCAALCGTWEGEEEVCSFGVGGGGVVWWGSLSFRFLFTSNLKNNKTNNPFISNFLFIKSLSSLGFPGKNIAWSLLFT